MASGVQPAKDGVQMKAPSTTTTTKTTSSTVGVKQKLRGAGCSSTSKSAGGSGAVSALMLREMEELRNVGMGSPVPTPRTDDDVDLFVEPFDDESYPAIRIDRCASAVEDGADDETSKRSEDRTRNARPRDDATKGGVVTRSSTSNHAKSGQRYE